MRANIPNINIQNNKTNTLIKFFAFFLKKSFISFPQSIIFQRFSKKICGRRHFLPFLFLSSDTILTTTSFFLKTPAILITIITTATTRTTATRY